MIQDQESILDSLKASTPRKQLAFALLVFERMLPSLLVFSKDTGRDDSCFLQAKDSGWHALQERQEQSVYESLKDSCLENTPDTEAFSHDLTSDALNAALVMVDIMEFILDGRVDHIAAILRLATDSVSLYLSNLDTLIVSSPQGDDWIAAHPIMQQEIHREEEDIIFLACLPDEFDSRTISALRARATSQPPVRPFTR